MLKRDLAIVQLLATPSFSYAIVSDEGRPENNLSVSSGEIIFHLTTDTTYSRKSGKSHLDFTALDLRLRCQQSR
jgi:hypothetical protein